MLVLCMLLGGGGAYVISRGLEPTYEASTLLMIGGGLDVVNPTTGELQTSEKLAQTYAEVIKTQSVLGVVQASLALAEEPRVTVTVLRNTQLMRITAEDATPQRAAAIADQLARQLILQSPSAPQREEQAYREFVRKQLNDLEEEISLLSLAIGEARASAGAGEVARLQGELNVRRENYSSLLNYIKGSNINYIRVVEPAQVPDEPTRPRVMQNTVLAAVLGLMLAAGVAYLIESLDDSIKGQNDIEHVLGLPTLGAIAHVSESSAQPGPVSLSQPASIHSEAYRILYTNVRYSLPAGSGRRIYLVTSVAPSEGKTTTAANLAVAMARAGQRTILVDADMRRPDVFRVFGCSNQVGLSSLLVGEVDSVNAALQASPIELLSILPSGPRTPNAAELLGSARMVELLEVLGAQADAVVLDSPPVLAVADASILASLVAGTILVVESGRTRLGACAQAAESVKKTGGNLLGVVLNRVNSRQANNGGYYYYAYDSDDDSKRRKKPGRVAGESLAS
jgi:non-specific protein-tyrosine kinase